MSNEPLSINEAAMESWRRYKPAWLEESWNEWLESNVGAHRSAWGEAKVFNVRQLCYAYESAFKAGVMFKITKELPDE